MTTTTLSQDTLRKLALMQHLGEEFFILDGIAYEGNINDATQDFEAANQLDDTINFIDYCAENFTTVEEFDTDDYNNDYLVFTDDEANEKWEESLDSYLEECIYPELTGNLKNYFDDEKWKQDAKYDGRGHSLSSYDGNENEVTVENETFYIYRIN